MDGQYILVFYFFCFTKIILHFFKLFVLFFPHYITFFLKIQTKLQKKNQSCVFIVLFVVIAKHQNIYVYIGRYEIWYMATRKKSFESSQSSWTIKISTAYTWNNSQTKGKQQIHKRNKKPTILPMCPNFKKKVAYQPQSLLESKKVDPPTNCNNDRECFEKIL